MPPPAPRSSSACAWLPGRHCNRPPATTASPCSRPRDGQLTVTIGGEIGVAAASGLDAMRLYNTLTRQQDEFAPSLDNTVRMYTCGLTVYARGHIGNFRTFVCVDVLRRALKYVAGYKMHHVMNFTDVDDKTIAGAAKSGLPLREYTEQFITAFREDAAGARHRAGRGHAARHRR